MSSGIASRGHGVGRAGRSDHDVRVRERVLERGDAVAVHVRLERRDRLDLDHGDPSALAARVAGEPLADPAVADDAELAAGEVEVRQPVDRGERRLAGAVAVVEEVLAAGVVGGDRREGEPAGGVHGAQARDAGRRLLGDAGEPRGELGPVLEDPRGQLGAVVDDELGLGVGDRQQVGVELLARGVVRRVHLDPARDERGADRVLRRARVRAGGDDLRARLCEQQSRGTPSSPPGGRRLRRGARAALRPRAASRASRFRTGECRATHWIRCSPAAASDGSAMRERAGGVHRGAI